ncbi:hypothetical protein P7J26_02395 [Streptococcus suis]|uniref:Uncharacterized protein n=1 Tax=Streptococcus suis TaxID=1307 RepID=A0A4T2H9A1_STRSU|nr:hypothetical protein [Streptococcus suis]TII08828.1 hypothetical protein FAJ34_02065 [Streptococcus suis]
MKNQLKSKAVAILHAQAIPALALITMIGMAGTTATIHADTQAANMPVESAQFNGYYDFLFPQTTETLTLAQELRADLEDRISEVEKRASYSPEVTSQADELRVKVQQLDFVWGSKDDLIQIYEMILQDIAIWKAQVEDHGLNPIDDYPSLDGDIIPLRRTPEFYELRDELKADLESRITEIENLESRKGYWTPKANNFRNQVMKLEYYHIEQSLIQEYERILRNLATWRTQVNES